MKGPFLHGISFLSADTSMSFEVAELVILMQGESNSVLPLGSVFIASKA